MPLHIDPEKGVLTFVTRTGKQRVAGTRDAYGYVCVRHNGKTRKAHRVIYEHVHGPLPAYMQIDHINGVRTDNRISNLRAVTNMHNCQNRHKATKLSATGVKGVCWNVRLQKYVAQISAAGHVYHLGVFTDIAEAAEMYAAAASFFHLNNPSAESR